MTGPDTGPSEPLARLFAIGYRYLVDGLHEQLVTRGWPDVRPSYGFVLLAARASGVQIVDLAALLGVTKQAASKLVDGMQQAGYVRREGHPRDGRAKTIALTARGHDLLDAVEQIYIDLEADWASVLGGDRLEELRADLTRVLTAAHGGRLPAVRPA